MKKLITIMITLFLITSCNNAQDCNKLPKTFNSYKEAIKQIKKGSFKFKDKANTSRSSWITTTEYYSCDGNAGYFIYTTNRNYEYIHEGVPIEIWQQFKNSPSFGTFYNTHIKGKYQLTLN